MEGIALEFFPNTDKIRSNEPKPEFYLYISDDNEQYACNFHDYMFHWFNRLIELGIIVAGNKLFGGTLMVVQNNIYVILQLI